MHCRFTFLLLLPLCSAVLTIDARTLLENHPFKVVISEESGKQAFHQTIIGDERKNNSQNRLSIISESQRDYPNPETACGPIALLNTLIWYEAYGLIEPLYQHPDPSTKRLQLFADIDRRILQKSGATRGEQGGSRNIDIAMTLDELVSQQSDGVLRIHTDFFDAPLRLPDLLETMPNFRSGYIFGFPKDRSTGNILSLHAVSLIRVDRAGYITLATWGEKYRGLLRMRDGKQWFIPQNPDHLEIQIVGMMRFIPFTPTEPANPKLP